MKSQIPTDFKSRIRHSKHFPTLPQNSDECGRIGGDPCSFLSLVWGLQKHRLGVKIIVFPFSFLGVVVGKAALRLLKVAYCCLLSC